MIRITAGIAEHVEAPEILVRVELIDATGHNRASQLAGELKALSDAEIDIEVVSIGAFDSHQVRNSFIVSRETDLGAAKKLAGKIGLDESQVLYRSAIADGLAVTHTVVIGDDFESLLAELVLRGES